MISLRCASSPSPPCEWRRSRGGVSFGSYGISGFGCLSPGPTRSPVSPLAGNIDSLPGQVALALLLLRDAAHALQFRHVRERPARSLKPLTSHGARARHPRLSQAAMASGAHPAVALNGRLIRNGVAPLHDDHRHPGSLPSGRIVWPDRTVEAAVRSRQESRVAWPVYAVPPDGCMRVSEKNDDRDAIVSLYDGTVVTRALASVLSSASRLYGMHGSVCRACHGDLT